MITGSLFLVTSTATAQASNDVQAAVLLRASLLALTGGNPIRDVRMEASATRMAGSDEENGTAILDARSTASHVSLSLPNGQLLEVRNDTTGFWSGPDGVAHAIPLHNTRTSDAWFFPALVIQQALSGGDHSAVLVKPGDASDSNFEQIRLVRIPSVLSGDMSPEIQKLSATDLLLDRQSLLPISISFLTHPDSDLSVDIPVRIEFSDYRTVSGRKAPFRIKKFLNDVLLLDLTISKAALDAGLPDSEFNVQ